MRRALLITITLLMSLSLAAAATQFTVQDGDRIDAMHNGERYQSEPITYDSFSLRHFDPFVLTRGDESYSVSETPRYLPDGILLSRTAWDDASRTLTFEIIGRSSYCGDRYCSPQRDEPSTCPLDCGTNGVVYYCPIAEFDRFDSYARPFCKGEWEDVTAVLSKPGHAIALTERSAVILLTSKAGSLEVSSLNEDDAHLQISGIDRSSLFYFQRQVGYSSYEVFGGKSAAVNGASSMLLTAEDGIVYLDQLGLDEDDQVLLEQTKSTFQEYASYIAIKNQLPDCPGCAVGSECVAWGQETDLGVCTSSGQIEEKKSDGASCEYSIECASQECWQGTCVASCAGCRAADGSCVPIDSASDTQFCTDSYELIDRKEAWVACTADFECLSNVCDDSLCIAPCEGCLDEVNECRPYGTVRESSFCADSGEFERKLLPAVECSYDGQCASGYCDGICRERPWWSFLMFWK